MLLPDHLGRSFESGLSDPVAKESAQSPRVLILPARIVRPVRGYDTLCASASCRATSRRRCTSADSGSALRSPASTSCKTTRSRGASPSTSASHPSRTCSNVGTGRETRFSPSHALRCSEGEPETRVLSCAIADDCVPTRSQQMVFGSDSFRHVLFFDGCLSPSKRPRVGPFNSAPSARSSFDERESRRSIVNPFIFKARAPISPISSTGISLGPPRKKSDSAKARSGETR